MRHLMAIFNELAEFKCITFKKVTGTAAIQYLVGLLHN